MIRRRSEAPRASEGRPVSQKYCNIEASGKAAVQNAHVLVMSMAKWDTSQLWSHPPKFWLMMVNREEEEHEYVLAVEHFGVMTTYWL